jgi:hypothetical protein
MDRMSDCIQTILLMGEALNMRTGSPALGSSDVGLKAPGILTFMLSVILTVVALLTKFFHAEIPLLTGNEIWVLLGAQVILALGCMLRGL